MNSSVPHTRRGGIFFRKAGRQRTGRPGEVRQVRQAVIPEALGRQRLAIRRSCVLLRKGIPCGRSGLSRKRMTGQYRTCASRVSTSTRKRDCTITASVTTTRMWGGSSARIRLELRAEKMYISMRRIRVGG